MAYGNAVLGGRAAAARASALVLDATQPDVIELAHQRSIQCGLDPADVPDFGSASAAELAEMLERHHQLYTHALPVMETLYGQIRNTQNMVLLTNSDGLILHALGDDDFLEKADKVALKPGVTWSESSKGTNAIGTALIQNQPTVVNASQHYLRVNHFLTCSCAPILDPYGRVIGALDVTGEEHTYHPHTLALVRMSALMVENHVFAAAFAEGVRIHFHSRPEFIGTLMEGIVAFTAGGRFLSANRSAQFQLGLSLEALRTHTFPSLFGMAMSALFDHYRTSNPRRVVTSMHNGVTVHLHAEFRAPSAIFGPAGWAASREPQGDRVDPGTPRDAGTERAARAAPGPRGVPASRPLPSASRPALSALQYLDTGDARLTALIAKINKVIGRDVPILLLGETGTGKELLAKAIHQDSPRRGGPFVAVDCASIPETLIESELFGHAEGAFTGARKAGSVGKLAQANGGTLFLDEIGDMPIGLQTRLLRVLQERTVSPLGGGRPMPVDFSVICATHRNLRDSIAAQRFREDLYYRINGLVLTLPPLRERTDLETIVHRLLDAEHDGRLDVDPQVMALFERHGWPGNLRQLTGLLRTAGLMAADDGVVRIEHLPEDFLSDVMPPDAGAGVDVGAAAGGAGTVVGAAAGGAGAGAGAVVGTSAGAGASASTGDWAACGPGQAVMPPAGRPAGDVAASTSTSEPHGTAPAVPHQPPAGARLEDVQLSAIVAALDRHRGNVSAAAKALGISRNTIYRRISQKPVAEPA